jgi:hypothetical protein
MTLYLPFFSMMVGWDVSPLTPGLCADSHTLVTFSATMMVVAFVSPLGICGMTEAQNTLYCIYGTTFSAIMMVGALVLHS